MSKNSPYEQDSGVLSTILGTTALAGLGYASYSAVSDPNGFEEVLTKVFNRVFPVVTQDPDAFQARNITANNAIREGERIASIARKNSFIRASERRSKIANSFVVSDGIDKDLAEQAYSARSNIGTYDFTEWGHTKGFEGEDRLVKAVNEITSGRGYKYGFNGTTMEFDLGGNKPLKLHIPKFHDELGVWLAKEDNKTLRVHRAETVAYNKTAKEYQLIKARNPIEEVAHTLENPLKMLTVINRDIDTNGYDIRKIRQLVGAHPGYYDLPLAEKQKVVNEVVHGLKRDGLLYNSNLKTEFTNLSQRELQDVFDHITMEQGRYVAHDEVARMQFFGMQGKISDYSRIINEDNFQQIGVGNLETGAATTGEDIKRFYSNILNDIGYKDSGWYLNQDMTQKGVFSMISPHTAIGQSEQFKGISKGVRFYDNLAASKTVTGRTAPLIKNPNARNVPKYFINDEPVVNLLSVIDPTIGPETILLNQEVGNNMKVVTSKTYNLRSMVRKVKDVSGGNHSDVNIEWSSGKTQAFNSLDDFYRHVQNKDLDVTKAIKRVSFNKSTVFGLNNGNDIINRPSDIAMAREIGMTGNPVLSEAGGFISGENAARGFRSWLGHSAGKAPVTQLTVSLVEDAKKMSETTTKLRTSVSLLDPEAPMALGKVGPVDAYQSWSWFKGTIMKGNQLGKNSPEYLSFLQSSILGHIAYNKKDLTVPLDSNTMKLFESMAHIPEEIKTSAVNGIVSVKSMINHPEFRMLQRSEKYGEQVIGAQRMLASLRSGAAYYGRVLSAGASARSLTRLYQIMESVKDGKMDDISEISGKNAWAYLSSYVGNETTSTSLGIGDNRFAFGLKEAHLLRRNQGILKELSMFNKVDTASIYDWGFKTLNSISGDLDVAKEGIKVLGSENAEELIGKDVAWLEQSASNLKLPEVRMNTMFGDSSISPNGFAVRVAEEDGKIGTRFIAPSDFWGVNHYLGEKDMITGGEDMMAAAELVRDALIRGGKETIASKDARKKFDEVQQKIHTQFAKGGFTRTGAIQVETATYDSNVVAHSSLGNDRLMRNLERSGGEAAELRYILGNSVFQSDELYRSTLRAKLEHADASRGQLTLASHVKKLFGEESRIAQAVTDMGGDIGKTVSLMSQESVALSKRITQAAHPLTTKENLLDADIAQIKDLVRDIRSSADVGLYLRDPVLYPHSGVRAFTFATDAVQIAQDKMLSGGDIISTLMNMDNDGDKIKQFMLLSAEARKEAIADMMKEQKVSYSVLTSMKKSPLAKPAGHWINGKGGAMRAIEESEAEAFENAARSLGETEGAIAAYSLKALTGSVDVRTHGLVSHILSTAKQRGFSEEEVREMELFAGNTIPLTLVQDAISSKHIARSINNADSRLLGMLKNIGGITEEEFKKNLKASGGDIDVLSFMTITNKLNSNRNEDRWVKQGVEHLDTLLAVSRNYKTVSEGQYRKAVEWIGYNTQESKDGWDRLLTERQRVTSELGEDAAKGLFERGGAVEKYGFIGFQEYAKGVGNRELKKLQMEFNKLTRSARKGQSEQEIAVQALRNISSTFGERTQASREIFTGVDLVSHRTMIGLKETMGFVKEHLLNHPTRMIGAAGLAMVGVTAVNMLFGDATPMSPNDLPSVNNPSFRDNRYNNMLENRQLNNVPNANVSSGLLTDSSNSYDSVMNHLQSNFGSHYSSVSVRHDGQDPYKEHMMRYNM